MLSLMSLSLDQTLTQWVAAYGAWALALVALIVFAETGLVVAPFLPGDSLLFLTGAVFAAASLNVHVAVLVLTIAAILGDALNFTVGRHAAPFVLRHLRGRWLRQAHLDATHRYFERFGGATVVIARFVPVIRTLAPFWPVQARWLTSASRCSMWRAPSHGLSRWSMPVPILDLSLSCAST